MSVQHVMAICPILAEIFQSGPKRSTERQTNIALHEKSLPTAMDPICSLYLKKTSNLTFKSFPVMPGVQAKGGFTQSAKSQP